METLHNPVILSGVSPVILSAAKNLSLATRGFFAALRMTGEGMAGEREALSLDQLLHHYNTNDRLTGSIGREQGYDAILHSRFEG